MKENNVKVKLKYFVFLLFVLLISGLWFMPEEGKQEMGLTNSELDGNILFKSGTFRIYNDPHSDMITISYLAKEEGNGLIAVFYADGKLEGRKLVKVIRGINTYEYHFRKISTGLYLVRFATAGREETGRIYKTVQ